jgi:excisionase family DNA binding protein
MHVNFSKLAADLRQHTGLMTAPELAAFLNVAKDTIYKWARTGILPSVQFAACTRFDPKGIADWLDRKQPICPREVNRER